MSSHTKAPGQAYLFCGKCGALLPEEAALPCHPTPVDSVARMERILYDEMVGFTVECDGSATPPILEDLGEDERRFVRRLAIAALTDTGEPKEFGADPALALRVKPAKGGLDASRIGQGESDLYATMWWIVGNSDLTSEVNQRARMACLKARGGA